tara:strand:+ start:1314 stop:1463 length:150 start_codon:yes stop_codon:yes gene_type:complete
MNNSLKKKIIIKNIFSSKTALPLMNEIGRIEKKNRAILFFDSNLEKVIN